MALLVLFLFSLHGVASARAFGKPVTYQADGRPIAIAVGDFNSDGNPDLAVSNAGTSDVSILLGNGDGTFQPSVNYPVGSLHSSPAGVAVTCETLGGKGLDLVVDNRGDDTVSVLVGNGDGTFQPAVDYSVGTGIGPFGVIGSVDFNADGNCDFAVTNQFGGTNHQGNISILLGNGDGTFQPAVNYDTLGVEPSGIAFGDFNNDLSPDLAVTDLRSGDVTILLNNGNGVFTASVRYPVGGPVAVTLYAEANLVVTSSGVHSGISLLHGNGDGTFAHIKNFPLGRSPYAVAQGFFNGDSTPDIAVADYDKSSVYVLLGRPSPQLGFRPEESFLICGAPTSVVAFDFNHDNKTDLAAACTNGVGVALNTSP
jgi:hypothetical protein